MVIYHLDKWVLLLSPSGMLFLLCFVLVAFTEDTEDCAFLPLLIHGGGAIRYRYLATTEAASLTFVYGLFIIKASVCRWASLSQLLTLIKLPSIFKHAHQAYNKA